MRGGERTQRTKLKGNGIGREKGRNTVYRDRESVR
jgi:hypothetical protein